MSGGATAKLKFFDENSGWTDRRPSAAPANSFTGKSITVCNVDFSHAEPSEIDRFSELLAAHSPSVAIMQNVSPVALTRMKGSGVVRKMFAVLETSRSEQHEDSTIALLRLGLQCEPTEAALKPEGKNLLRALIQVHIRPAGGPTLSITILNMEPSVTQHRRLTVASTVLKSLTSADVMVLVSNVAENVVHSEEMYRELQNTRSTAGFVDCMEEGPEKVPGTPSPWCIWMKSVKYGVSAAVADLLRGQEARYLCTTLALRTIPGANTIAIPMPRSAKTGRTRSPSSSGTTQILTDPAVVSAEAAKTTGSQVTTPGSDIIMRLMRQQQQPHPTPPPRWKLSHSFPLKGVDAKLTSAEAIFDVSTLFANPADAVDELNAKTLNWPAEFCVVHGTVLCSEAVPHCDRQAFRRYARDCKANTALSAQLYAAMSTFAAVHNSEKATWAKQIARAEPEDPAAFARTAKREEVVRKEWSEACCTIVYQITPREMKFNITQSVGMAKDNLKRAIYLLNRSKSTTKETNPLNDYPYDYALLFSVERQAYWLIAATHVPCDIVACRMVV